MFSSKNYGLPKELIEAAKRVHEKQLMEYDEDGYIDNPPEGMNKGTKKDREKRENAAKMRLRGPYLEREGRLPQNKKPSSSSPVREPKNEEVQFTEEELAEAFAAFLEENFHVEMLTEEDLDYVFEEEFPQWLEESATARIKSREEQRLRAKAEQAAAKLAAASDSQDAKEGAQMRQRAPRLAAQLAGQSASRGRIKPTVSGITGTPSENEADRRQAAAREIAAASDSQDAKEGAQMRQRAAELAAKRERAAQSNTGARTKPSPTARRAPKTDYKTPISTRDPVTGTYQLTDKGRKYVAKTSKKPDLYSSVFGND